MLVLAAGAGLPVDSLSVPVVDLVDVAKHNLVFSFHVVRDALLLDPLHVALRREGQSSAPLRSPALSHVCLSPSLIGRKQKLNDVVSYLHHDAQVLDVVLLSLDQLLQHEPEQTQTAAELGQQRRSLRGRRGQRRPCGRGRLTVILTSAPSWLWLVAPARGSWAALGCSAPEGTARRSRGTLLVRGSGGAGSKVEVKGQVLDQPKQHLLQKTSSRSNR